MNILAATAIFIEGLRLIGAVLCDVIYRLIAWLFQLFITVSRLNILSGSSEITKIYQRITIILTTVMTFYIVFEFVKYLVQPDKITDKEQGVGNLALRLIGVILLIAFVPTIFSLAYKAQNIIIEKQVFSKIFLGIANRDFGQLGGEFSASLLTEFYKVDPDVCPSTDNGECEKAAKIVDNNLNRLRGVETEISLPFSLVWGINDEGVWYKEINLFSSFTPLIEFHGIFAIIVGGFVAYVLVLYTIDMGSRYIQMIFLQMVAPIAIMSFALPKKNSMFEKWCKQCLTTYINIFLRLAIMYFALISMNIISEALDSGNVFVGIGESVTWPIKTVCKIAVIMGLMMFMHRAPKLLEDLFPSKNTASIGLGLKGKDRFEPTTQVIKGTVDVGKRVAGGVAGAVAGAVTGGAIEGTDMNGWNKGWSIAKAVVKGVKTGAGKGGSIRKGAQAANESVEQDIDTSRAGGTPLGADFRQTHFKHEAKTQDRKIKELEAAKQNKDAIRGSVDEYAGVKSLRAAWESAKQGGQSQEEIDRLYANYKAARDAMVNANAISAAGKGNYEFKFITGYEEETYTDEDGNTKTRLKEITETRNIHVDASEATTYSVRTHELIERTHEIAKETALGDTEVEIIRDGEKQRVKVAEMTAQEYAKNLGKIDDAADTEMTSVKYGDQFREAHANANGSGGNSNK